MKRTKRKIGKCYRSNYRSKWTGYILDLIPRNNQNDLGIIIIVQDKNGNIPKERILKCLDVSWLEPYFIDIDISDVNKDWFDLKSLPLNIKNRCVKYSQFVI